MRVDAHRPPAPLPPARKALIGAFIALNLLTVGFSNIPETAHREIAARVRPSVSPTTWWRMQYGSWWLQSYAHAVGLDNRWVMFSSVYRSDWQLQIRAKYRNGASRLLPLPLQGERTFWERWFTDFREAKFHLNIYADAPAKDAYAGHLARRFPQLDGAVIDAIVFEVRERPFVASPQEARARGTHFAGPARTELLAVSPITSP